MIAEDYKELPLQALNCSRPIGFQDTKGDYPFLGFTPLDDKYFLSTISPSSLPAALLLDVLTGYVGITGNIHKFHRMLFGLLGEDGCKTLFTERKVKWSDYNVRLGNLEGSYISFNKGNSWGFIYCLDNPEASPNKLENAVENLLGGLLIAGWEGKRLKPLAKMAEELVRREMLTSALPFLADGEVDIIHLQRAWNCFRGGRMEVARLGTFHNVHDYDYNSAYASLLGSLPPTSSRYVKWIDSKEYQENALLGYCYCWRRIDEDAPLGLIPLRKRERLYFNTGETEQWMTKTEIDFIQRSGLGEVEIMEGSWAIPVEDSYPFPFAPVTKSLRRMMSVESPSIISYFKEIAARSWGKFASPGAILFNPFYAAEITARMRVQVTEMALPLNRDLIAIAVDGFALIKELPKVVLSQEMGGLKYKLLPKMISATDAFRYIPGKHNGKWELGENGVVLPPIKVTIPYALVLGSLDRIGEEVRSGTIPYGSSKRYFRKDLKLKDLDKQIPLYPPTPEDVLILSVTRRVMGYEDDFL